MHFNDTQTEAAFSALLAGGDPNQVLTENSDSVDTSDGEDLVDSDTGHVETLDKWAAGDDSELSEDQEAPEKDEVSQPDSSEESTETDEPEYVKADGKKIRVDYQDKAKIRKAYEMAAGMRKFQKERDDVKRDIDSLRTENAEFKEMWSKVKEAADREDTNELVRIMTGGKMDFETLISQRLEKEKLLEDATEEEIEVFKKDERISQLEKQLNKLTSQLDENLKSVSQQREEAEYKSLQAKVDPVFDKFRFAGKLGDQAAEQRLDKMLWQNAISELERYDELTPELIRKEFKEAASVLDRVITKKADDKRQKVSKERKRVAKQTAQVESVRGYGNSDLRKEAAQKIKDGDLNSLFKDWEKYGKLF